VYNGSVSQEEVYESSVQPLLTTLLDGYNVTGETVSFVHLLIGLDFLAFAIVLPTGELIRDRCLFRHLLCKSVVVGSGFKILVKDLHVYVKLLDP